MALYQGLQAFTRSDNMSVRQWRVAIVSIRYQDKYVKKDGALSHTDEPKYLCSHRSRYIGDCDGQHTYKAKRIDAVVTAYAKAVLAQIKTTPKDVNIELRAGKRIRQLGAARISAAEKLEKRRKELDRLQEEIGRCLLGESRFSEDVLSNQIDRIVSEVRGIQKELDGIESELQNQNAVRDNLGGLYTQFVCWADEFEKADIPRKKMILCELFSRVELRKGYDVSIYINPAYGQFLEGAGEDMKTFGEM